MTFIPNTTCSIRRKGTSFDFNGGAVQLQAPVVVPCSVVKLGNTKQKTSVRADSSASRGFADEIVADARLLLPKTVQIGIDDVIEILGVSVRVCNVAPQKSVLGKLDHIQVDADSYEEDD